MSIFSQKRVLAATQQRWHRRMRLSSADRFPTTALAFAYTYYPLTICKHGLNQNKVMHGNFQDPISINRKKSHLSIPSLTHLNCRPPTFRSRKPVPTEEDASHISLHHIQPYSHTYLTPDAWQGHIFFYSSCQMIS